MYGKVMGTSREAIRIFEKNYKNNKYYTLRPYIKLGYGLGDPGTFPGTGTKFVSSPERQDQASHSLSTGGGGGGGGGIKRPMIEAE
jgi:hypothetical protein